MSCEAAEPPRRRSLAGWVMLGALVALGAVYAHVFQLVLSPHVDEAYRRTFVTSEFGVFPEADAFAPDDGLAYRIGASIDFHDPDQRRFLSRFDWEHNEQPVVTMRGTRGRLYLHVTGKEAIAARPHRLTMTLHCQIPLDQAGNVDVSINGQSVGSADCGMGTVTIEATVPAKLIGVARYDTIEVRREAGSLYERMLTRLGGRARAVELVALTFSPT